MSQKSELRTRASTVVIHNGKLLVVKLQDPHSKIVHWYPPGGKVEPVESPVNAAERETLEETGVKVKVDPQSELIVDYPFVWNAKNYFVKTYFYRAEVEKLPELNYKPKDASFNLGWGWLEKELWKAELGFCHPILDSVRKLAAFERGSELS